MQQVLIVGRRRDAQTLVTALQDAGVMHVVPLSSGPLASSAVAGGSSDERKTAERLLARAESTIAELGLRRPLGALPSVGEDEWESAVEVAAAPSAQLARELGDVRADVDAARTYGDVVRALAELASGLDRSRRMAVLPFVLPKNEGVGELERVLRQDLEERFALDTRVVGNVTAGVVVALARERDKARAALGKARIGELRLPGRFEGMPLSQAASELAVVAKSGDEQLQRLEAQRTQLAEQHGARLFAARDALVDQVAVYDVQGLAARGKYSIVLRGFVPDDRVPALRSTLDGFGDAVSYELTPADEHHGEEVPVELKNRGYFQRMEPLLGLFPPPRYGTFDPTPIIGVFFPFFFGFVIADIAYGLLLLWLGITLANMARAGRPLVIGLMGVTVPPVTLGNVAYIVKWMAGWSILWGFLTGEFFGTLLEHMHVFYIPGHGEGGLIPILFPRLETSFVSVVLVVSLAFGIIQVIWAWLIRIQLTARHGHKHHMWEAIGMLGGLIGLIFLSYQYLQGGFGVLGNVGNPLNLIMYLGFAVFLLGLVMARVPLMILELISNGGALLSYSRLFAVGLASAVLARLATDTGWSLYELYGPIGAVLGIIVGLLIHVIAVLFTIIGHVLQPLRLNYVEFLTRTGFYEGSGRRYSPFRRLSTDR
ncbi:archaeal/vacuolar-type H+-ATPase subunit I [Deinococcus peraridilitoris DSM 19664]|uniref:Archaeal/vacuolar-type H+-ATPase subunit I n=2 Tax=Deinococcus TaxID=1298 RepID=L0A1V8_DEIPD|nr:archaeal/vacuolar-type H+-ATPase subunit I [Deinococcus peraridilitoris DSM 19664]